MHKWGQIQHPLFFILDLILFGKGETDPIRGKILETEKDDARC